VPALPEGKTKLIQYLNEAYGLERRLETALQAHLALATRPTYKQRLRAHLSETKRHGRDVQRRIKQLGGTAETVDLPGPEVVSDIAQTAVAGAQRAVALAQGPLHALRGTGEEEKQLKNAKTEYASEAEEIATYSAIIALAETLRDTDTVRLARTIMREEQRMSTFLGNEIPRMVKAVAKAEIPAGQRPAQGRRTRSSASPARGGASLRTRKTPAKRTSPKGSAKRLPAKAAASVKGTAVKAGSARRSSTKASPKRTPAKARASSTTSSSR
jgi:ferritin-like metal-binding protein YciE